MIKVYTTKELAKELNINPETIRRWVRGGFVNADCRSKKEGAIIYFDVENYVTTRNRYFEKPTNETVRFGMTERQWTALKYAREIEFHRQRIVELKAALKTLLVEGL